MEDRLTIKSLLLQGRHGLFEEERIRGNRFELDVHFFGDFRSGGKKDDLSLVPDYSSVAGIAGTVLDGPSHNLIESLCSTIGDRLFNEFPAAHRMVVTLRKMDPPVTPPASYAEIEMQWQR
ncbi:MAG: dihydroneopterin aldolase [Balneolaceae bacterium]